MRNYEMDDYFAKRDEYKSKKRKIKESFERNIEFDDILLINGQRLGYIYENKIDDLY